MSARRWKKEEAGRTNEVVLAQLNAVLDVIGPEMLVTGALAYEPVWAIGTGKTAIPEEAQEVHKILRDSVKITQFDAGDSFENNLWRLGKAIKCSKSCLLVLILTEV